MVYRRSREAQRADSAVHHFETHCIPSQPRCQVVQEESKQMAGKLSKTYSFISLFHYRDAVPLHHFSGAY